MAIDYSKAQLGSTPECSESVSKNQTRYTRHRKVEREVLTVSESRLGVCHSPALGPVIACCLTVGSGIRACAPACHQLKPGRTHERGIRREYTGRTRTLNRCSHSWRQTSLSHHDFGRQRHLPTPVPSHPLISRNLSLYLMMRMDQSQR